MKLKMYEYAKCDTCRKAAKFLQEQGVEFSTVPIREQPPTKAELERMLRIYNGERRKLLNTSGQDYKALHLKDRLDDMTDKELIDLLSKNGNLIKRPFVLAGAEGIVGFNEENWGEFLKRTQTGR